MESSKRKEEIMTTEEKLREALEYFKSRLLAMKSSASIWINGQGWLEQFDKDLALIEEALTKENSELREKLESDDAINALGLMHDKNDELTKKVGELEEELDLFQNLKDYSEEELNEIAARYVNWGAEMLARQKVKYQRVAGRHAKEAMDAREEVKILTTKAQGLVEALKKISRRQYGDDYRTTPDVIATKALQAWEGK